MNIFKMQFLTSVLFLVFWFWQTYSRIYRRHRSFERHSGLELWSFFFRKSDIKYNQIHRFMAKPMRDKTPTIDLFAISVVTLLSKLYDRAVSLF